MSDGNTGFGDLMRSWRERRHLSQLDLAIEAEVSQKHLSFIESGRSAPSREMVLRLSDYLDVPLRDRNDMLMAAGFAPVFRARPLTDPALSHARDSIDRLLKAHEPYPALAFDRRWNLISRNEPIAALLSMVAPHLLTPPVNILRTTLHPEGLAPRIVNLAQWRRHLLDQLKRQIRRTHDAFLEDLLRELSVYPVRATSGSEGALDFVSTDDVALPIRLATPDGVLSLLTTVTVFGTAFEITLSEVTLETFYPADASTAALLLSKRIDRGSET